MVGDSRLPPQTHPFGGYDGLEDSPWSMTRLCILDNYPFYGDLSFDIESGPQNDQELRHTGAIFYYGIDDKRIEKLQKVNTDSSGKVSFKVKLSKDNKGLCVVRDFYDRTPFQKAKVFVDSKLVEEREWMHVSDALFKLQDEDSFEIPSSYTEGKKCVKIEIEPCDTLWNASSYTVWEYK